MKQTEQSFIKREQTLTGVDGSGVIGPKNGVGVGVGVGLGDGESSGTGYDGMVKQSIEASVQRDNSWHI